MCNAALEVSSVDTNIEVFANQQIVVCQCIRIYRIRTSFISFSLSKWVECSPMVRVTWVQSQVTSYQNLFKIVLDTSLLKLSNRRYASRVKWSNPGKGVEPFPTSRCRSY